MSSLLTLNGNVLSYSGSAVTGETSTVVIESSKNYTVSSGGTQTILPDSGYGAMYDVSLTVPYKSAATYTPTTSDQTIAAGQWLNGVQTIVGDPNLSPSNIKEGVSIFGIPGTCSTKNTQINTLVGSTTATSYTDTTVSITVAKTGTYKICFAVWKSNNAANSTGRVYRNGTALTSTITSQGNYGERHDISSQELTQGDVLSVYIRSSSASYTTRGGYLSIEEV